MNFKEQIDFLQRNFAGAIKQTPINIYMNKGHLKDLNTCLNADEDRDLKRYKGSNIVIWRENRVAFGDRV